MAGLGAHREREPASGAGVGAEQDLASGIGLAEVLAIPWRIRGQSPELVSWFDKLPDGLPSLAAPVRAVGLRTYGRVLFFTEQYDRVQRPVEESLAIFRELGDRREEAATLRSLASSRWAAGDHATAIAHLEESLAICRSEGDQAGHCPSASPARRGAPYTGQLEAGRATLQEALALDASLGDRHTAMEPLHSLGDLELDAADWVRARECYREALAGAGERGDPLLQAYCLAGLACVAAGRATPRRPEAVDRRPRRRGAGEPLPVGGREGALRKGPREGRRGAGLSRGPGRGGGSDTRRRGEANFGHAELAALGRGLRNATLDGRGWVPRSRRGTGVRNQPP